MAEEVELVRQLPYQNLLTKSESKSNLINPFKLDDK